MAPPITTEVEIALSDQLLADEAKQLVGDDGELEERERFGALPIVGAVLAGALAAAAIARIVKHFRDANQCQQVMDFRHDKITIKVDCEVRNGKIIIVADKDQQVTVTEVPEIIDFTEIAKQAVTEGANVAKAAIESAGGKADVEDADGTDDSEGDA